jgi:antitoxin PrlF
MVTSKLSSKGRTTVPQAVRTALGLREGGQVAYQIQGDRVVLTSGCSPGLIADPFVAFHEWNSDADREAYADL